MNKAYNRINWENYPSDSTPLNENNLNKMDVAINEIDNRVISLDTTKLPVATAYTMVKDVEFDEKTGIFTITKLNGSVIKIDTALEKISTNFRFDYSTQKLILTLIDGTTQEVDLSALLTQYEFTDSDTIAFTIDTSGKVVASVKKGSITQDMLEPNYLANIKVEVAKAESASISADTSAKNAKTSETNAKNSEIKAKEYAEAAGAINTLISSQIVGANPTAQDSTDAPIISQTIKGYTVQDGTPTPDAPVEIESLGELQEDGSYKVIVKTCGKNLYNTAEQIHGVVNGSGNIATENVNYRHTIIPVLPNTKYTISANNGTTLNGGYLLAYYTKEHEWISTFVSPQTASATITTPENCYYLSLNDNVETDRMYQLEVGDTATDYEPYTETTAAITTDAPLYEGDYIEYRADGSGVLHRGIRRKTIDVTWTTLVELPNGNKGLVIALTDKSRGSAELCRCTKAPLVQENYTVGSFYVNPVNVVIVGTADDTLETLQAKYEGVEFVYPLATPTETELTAEQLAEFKQLRTFNSVTNIICDGETETTYYKATDNGEVVSALHEKVEASERAVNSANNYYSSFKQTFDTVVGGTVSNNTSNVEYTEPSFLNGSIFEMVIKGGTLVNGLKDATAKIAETLSSMCDFFIGKIAYNIGGKELIEDFDYENWIAEKSEAVEGAVEYPADTLERFERLIAQCVEASIKLNDSLKTVEKFELIPADGVTFSTNQCIYNRATGRVDVIADCTCSNAIGTGTAFATIPSEYLPKMALFGQHTKMNGNIAPGFTVSAYPNGNIVQWGTGGLTQLQFTISYYV